MLSLECCLEIVDAFDHRDGPVGLCALRQEVVQSITRAKYHMQAQLAAASGALEAGQGRDTRSRCGKRRRYS